MSLRDERDSSDPVLAMCARLVESADPIDPAGIMQARVRKAIASGGRARRRSWVLRPAVLTIMILCLLSIAAAMVAHQRNSRRPSGATEGVGDRALPRSIVAAEPVARSVAAVPAPAAPEAPVPVPSADPPPLRAHVAHHRVATSAEASPPGASERTQVAEIPEARAASPEEAQLVIAELEALRTAHDPDRAARLFDAYATRYPDGVLLEEALAYAIEAAVARNGIGARLLADRYLARFPHGRFRATAEHAKNRFDR
jgi:hypothetical protein